MRTRKKRAKHAATLILRLSREQRQALEALAAQHGCHLSAVVRDLIEQALACEVDIAPSLRWLKEHAS